MPSASPRSITDEMGWEEVGNLINEAILEAAARQDKTYRPLRSALVSTDSVLVEHRGERRFIVTVVLQAA